MDEEEVARRLRTRARAWRGALGSAEQSRWAQQGESRRRRWAWLPAITALVCVALFSAAAAAYAGGPAPVRRVLAPVGDRVTRPWHATPAEDRPNVQTDKLPSEPTPGPKTSPGATSPSSVEPSESAPRAVPSSGTPAEPGASASSPKSKEDSGSRPDDKRHASPQPSGPSSEPGSPSSKPSSVSPGPGSSSPEPSHNRDG
jgi:hypothetical protein